MSEKKLAVVNGGGKADFTRTRWDRVPTKKPRRDPRTECLWCGYEAFTK